MPLYSLRLQWAVQKKATKNTKCVRAKNFCLGAMLLRTVFLHTSIRLKLLFFVKIAAAEFLYRQRKLKKLCRAVSIFYLQQIECTCRCVRLKPQGFFRQGRVLHKKSLSVRLQVRFLLQAIFLCSSEFLFFLCFHRILQPVYRTRQKFFANKYLFLFQINLQKYFLHKCCAPQSKIKIRSPSIYRFLHKVCIFFHLLQLFVSSLLYSLRLQYRHFSPWEE